MRQAAVSGLAHVTVDEVGSNQPEVTTLSVPHTKPLTRTCTILQARLNQAQEGAETFGHGAQRNQEHAY